ncbi:protein TBATA [Chanos chanos]|uniref:Protein TBATA n=1 Tax=Chanos chanos TaxID=29144 RepID=A0A6J2VD19_CHACN|nr:protein TBATA [Chanos chanos]
MESPNGKSREAGSRPVMSNSHEGFFNKSKAESKLFENPSQLLADVAKIASRGSARFGMLSHHSFFSRHSPHPHRVTHIQGLNGNPVCIVNDDWYTSTPLYPHPLIRSQVPISTNGKTVFRPHGFQHGFSATKQGAALLSEAWREELRELATKLSQSAQARNDNKAQNEDDACQRTTQYSAKTGRIIPSSSWTSGRCRTQATRTQAAWRRHDGQRHNPPPHALDCQEIRVLELLCQILQTDSLSLVQQWLLLAGQREKDLVMGLLQQAMTDTASVTQRLESCREEPHPLFESLPPSELPVSQSQRKRRLASSHPSKEAGKDKPAKSSQTIDTPITTEGSVVSPSRSAKNLGVTLDNQLNFSSHITVVTWSS